MFVLPSTGFELTSLIPCSTIRLALCPAPETTIYIYTYILFTIDAIFEEKNMPEQVRKNLHYECCIHHNIKKK